MLNKAMKIAIKSDVDLRLYDYFEQHFEHMFSFLDYEKKSKVILNPLFKKYPEPEQREFIKKVAPIAFLNQLLFDDLRYSDQQNTIIFSPDNGKAQSIIQTRLHVGKFKPVFLNLYTVSITNKNKLKFVDIFYKSKTFDMKDENISKAIIEHIRNNGSDTLRTAPVQDYIIEDIEAQAEELLNKFSFNPVIREYDIPISYIFNREKIQFNNLWEERVIDFHIFVNNEYHFDLTKTSLNQISEFTENELSVMAEKIGLRQKIEASAGNKNSERL